MTCSSNDKEYTQSIKEIKDRKKTLSENLKDLFDEAMTSIDCLKNKKYK